MQRAAICLVAVLALLAGCSGGVGGGSDATPTETASTPAVTETPTQPTPTPEPGANDSDEEATETSEYAPLRVDEASASKRQVLEGEPVRFNATLSNRNDTVANQTVTIRVGNRTVYDNRIELGPGETRTGSLFILNTSAVRPGEKFVTVSTGNDSELLRLDIRPQDELETFINDVRLSSYTLENSTILGRDHVRFTFDTEEDVTELYKGGGSNLMPVPQAAAFEMATSEYAPSKVTVRHPPRYEKSEVPFSTSFNESLASDLYTGEVDAREFRDILYQHANGSFVEFLAPHWRTTSVPQEERFTFFTGDRARQEYAANVAEHLNNTNYEYINVSDYGLYNGTQRLPDTTRKLGPNSSIYVTVKMDDIYKPVQYHNRTTQRHAVTFERTLWKIANMTQYKTYGERPEFVQLRYIFPDGTKHSFTNIPTYMAVEAAKRGSVEGYYLPLTFDSPFTTDYVFSQED
jgi:hypothetical protein